MPLSNAAVSKVRGKGGTTSSSGVEWSSSYYPLRNQEIPHGVVNLKLQIPDVRVSQAGYMR